ncbi:DgyrCDS1827 [Dimorphilus gyrociliatus]|uniref:DgyrCDS1827 n=1 Tax=Dimorphilus gyrociliatus TaxID=2664684 RepID=A0A7I8V8P5_9ANNE|nr:DgyrCDS1827 [Dimorphilus gyrociliatus]
MSTIFVKYVSKKTKCVQWFPTIDLATDRPRYFVTGSWDNRPQNEISLWQIEGEAEIEDLSKIQSVVTNGDINNLQFLKADLLLAACSKKSVSVFQVSDNRLEHRNDIALSKEDICTSLISRKDGLVVCGTEHGQIFAFTIENSDKLQTLQNEDDCVINDIQLADQHQVVAATSSGQLKLWDLRDKGSKAQLYVQENDWSALWCIDKHPAQQHVIAGGTSDGAICIWDLRQPKLPSAKVEAHIGDVLDIQYHQSQPDHLFTCSSDGEIWHWDASNIQNSQDSQALSTPWLACDTAKRRIEITNLWQSYQLPINCLNVVNNSLIAGSDNEALAICNIIIR